LVFFYFSDAFEAEEDESQEPEGGLLKVGQQRENDDVIAQTLMTSYSKY
jgi:hypothetical protein